MAEDRRQRSSGGRGDGKGRPSSGSRDGARSQGSRDGRGRDDRPKSGGRDDRGRGSRDTRGGKFDRAGKPQTERRPSAKGRPAQVEKERSVDQQVYDGPPLPAEITGKELDRAISAQLKGLPEKLAARVARHLAAAGLLIETEPEVAYQHTLAARARAPRLAVVREAAGEAAYAAGHFAEALADLRAAKRMNGATAYLPIMADCHRALGQPDQALKLAKSPSVSSFPPEAKAEMTIVEAGARRDKGQVDAALRTLELAPLMSQTRAPWVVRLRYAYADALLDAGREQDALAWFHRTHAIDAEDLTDAADRAAELERRLG